MANASRAVAIFDFDHTLIKGDSLWPFLVYLAGWLRSLAALAEGVVLLGWRRLRGEKNPDSRTFLKQHLLHRLLTGRASSDIAQATARLYRWQKWNEPVLEALRDHHRQGHVIVVASGGLNLYLPELLRGLPCDALICTEIGMENNSATGAMTKGNCVRAQKAERIKEWLQANGPFTESWGYGNYPHDVPMLNLLKHRILV